MTVEIFPIWNTEAARIAETLRQHLSRKDYPAATRVWGNIIAYHRATISERGIAPDAVDAALEDLTREVRKLLPEFNKGRRGVR